MTSWIYVFSKFTPEALLFEALFICLLISSYAAFWILRKRRFGAVDNEVPASVVKVYLNELIGEAHDMRTQLFGLLAGGTVPVSEVRGHGPIITTQLSGDAAGKLSELEQKMADQAKAIENMMAEKAKLEKELADARASGVPAGGGDGDLQKLQDKCSALEARLAEYSVIEDDLANLKRLQQENTQLKAQLSSGSSAAASAPAAVPAPAVAATPAPAATPTEPAASAAPAEAAPTIEMPVLEAGPSAEAAHPAAPAAAAPAEPAAEAPLVPGTLSQDEIQAAIDAAAAGTSNFEGLVDQVEKSLQPAPSSTPETPAAAPAPATEKTDEDLIAEFEKMLNS